MTQFPNDDELLTGTTIPTTEVSTGKPVIPLPIDVSIMDGLRPFEIAIFRRMDKLLFNISNNLSLDTIIRAPGGNERQNNDYGRVITEVNKTLEGKSTTLGSSKLGEVRNSIGELEMLNKMLKSLGSSQNGKKALAEIPHLDQDTKGLIKEIDLAIELGTPTEPGHGGTEKTDDEKKQDIRLETYIHALYDIRFALLVKASEFCEPRLADYVITENIDESDPDKNTLQNLMGEDIEELSKGQLPFLKQHANICIYEIRHLRAEKESETNRARTDQPNRPNGPGASPKPEKPVPQNHDKGKLSDRSTSILGAIVRFFESIIRSHEIETFEKKEQLAKDPLYKAAKDLATTLETKLSKHLKSKGKELNLKGTLSADERLSRLLDALEDGSNKGLVESALKNMFEAAMTPTDRATSLNTEARKKNAVDNLKKTLEAYSEFVKNPREQGDEAGKIAERLEAFNKALGGQKVRSVS